MEKKIKKNGKKTEIIYKIDSSKDLIENEEAQWALQAELIRLRIRNGEIARRFK